MFVYAPGTFFVVKEQIKQQHFLHEPSYRLMEDEKVAVHLTWLIKGFEHSASYHHSIRMIEALDWCQEHCGRDFLMHREQNVLFRDARMATMFKLSMSGQ